MTTAFDNVNLPDDIEAGAQVGPQFSTTIVSMSGGKEQRNAEWDQERLTANIAWGIMQREDAADIENSFRRVMDFFRARRGRWRGFRFRDVSDYQAEQVQLFPDETNTKFQLVKTYDEYRRRITRPDESTLIVYVDGAIVPRGDLWNLDPLGVIRFNAPTNAAIKADFDFDVPVRFETDVAQVALEWKNAGSISNINLIQTRE